MGIVYGLFIGIIASITFASEPFSLALAAVVGLAILLSMAIAALVGSMVPLILERLRIDPAVATGPFVTTSIDIVSVYGYLIIASWLLGS